MNKSIPKKRFKQDDYKQLINRERFRTFSTCFMGNQIMAVDSASLLSQNTEIFGNEVYKFKANTTCPRIIDVGSNIGLSIIYYKLMFPSAKITGFEPDPEIFKALDFNLNSFEFKDVEIINKACFGNSGIYNFTSDHADGGYLNQHGKLVSGLKKVEAVRLSTYLDEPIHFLKLDVEGSELSILDECKSKLENIDNLFVEYHSFTKKPQSMSLVLRILEESGFRYYIEQNNAKRKHPFISNKVYDENEMDYQANIFCTRTAY